MLIKANLVFTVLSADLSKSVLQIICVRLFTLRLGAPVWNVLLLRVDPVGREVVAIVSTTGIGLVAR